MSINSIVRWFINVQRWVTFLQLADCFSARSLWENLIEAACLPLLRKMIAIIASGKRLHNYGKIHHFEWVNPLFNYFDWAIFKFSLKLLVYQVG